MADIIILFAKEKYVDDRLIIPRPIVQNQNRDANAQECQLPHRVLAIIVGVKHDGIREMARRMLARMMRKVFMYIAVVLLYRYWMTFPFLDDEERMLVDTVDKFQNSVAF
jgi:hypothetical protein